MTAATCSPGSAGTASAERLGVDDQTDLTELGRALARGARLGAGENAAAGTPPTLVAGRGSVTWRLPGGGRRR
jgi:hypothetical protein